MRNYISIIEESTSPREAEIEKIYQSIRRLFSDTSVSQEQTKLDLNHLIEEIEMLVDTLDANED